MGARLVHRLGGRPEQGELISRLTRLDLGRVGLFFFEAGSLSPLALSTRACGLWRGKSAPEELFRQ
jgi:hypothetical protein